MPVTTPAELTVAIVVVPELHAPVEAVSDNVIVDPWQTTEAPLIAPAFGKGETVTGNVVEEEPQPLVTV